MTLSVALVRGKWHSIWESLACGYLYSYTKDLVEPGDYVFFDGYFDSDEEIIKGCAEADIVGFSGTTSQMPWSLRIAAAIKQRSPDSRIFVGGYGPSVSPEWFIEESISIPRGPISGAVVGEGERPWRSILLSGGIQTGVIFEPAIPDLDSIPFPDRDFIKVERCIGVAKREEGRRVTGIFGNRGCLRRCKFCADGSPKTIYGVALRERSPKNILDEMEQVAPRYGIEFFKFADPEVNTRPGRIRELTDEFLRRKWRIPWGGNMLANPWEDGDGERLYDAACREVWIGLESGSLEIHKHIGKGVTPNLIRHAFKDAKDAGLMRRAYVLMGTPMETKETIKETEALIDEVMPDTVSFSILASYPGTEYYTPDMADWDWEHIDEYGGDANQFHNLGITKMNRRQLLDERNRLIEKYAGSLARIMQRKRELGWIENTSAQPPIGIIDTSEIRITDYQLDDPRP